MMKSFSIIEKEPDDVMNLFVKIADAEFDIEYKCPPKGILVSDFIKFCFEKYKEGNTDIKAVNLKSCQLEVNGKTIKLRLLKSSFFQNVGVDESLGVIAVTIAQKNKTVPNASADASSCSSLSTTEELKELRAEIEQLKLQLLLQHAETHPALLPHAIRETADALSAIADIRARAAAVSGVLSRLALLGTLLNTQDVAAVRDYERNVHLLLARADVKDEQSELYYQRALEVPFASECLARLIAENNRLVDGRLYKQFIQKDKSESLTNQMKELNDSLIRVKNTFNSHSHVPQGGGYHQFTLAHPGVTWTEKHVPCTETPSQKM